MDLTIILGGIVVVLLVVYYLYASMIKKKNRVQEALSSIDVQFQKRADLVPNMVRTAAKYMQHEKQLFEDIVELRNSVKTTYDMNNANAVAQHMETENQLQSKLGAFQVRMEAYPELKSDGTMIEAMKAMSNVENNISAARRFYNASVGTLNNAVETWPTSTFARKMGIDAMPFFEAEEKARESIDVSDFL